MTRAELIAALEAATGPSRELDASIGEALGVAPQYYSEYGYGDPAKDAPREHAPYTESIDAALSFTPEGWKPSLLSWAVPELTEPNKRVTAFMTLVTGDYKGHVRGDSGATPAIALCIANLRAIEAQGETNG